MKKHRHREENTSQLYIHLLIISCVTLVSLTNFPLHWEQRLRFIFIPCLYTTSRVCVQVISTFGWPFVHTDVVHLLKFLPCKIHVKFVQCTNNMPNPWGHNNEWFRTIHSLQITLRRPLCYPYCILPLHTWNVLKMGNCR